MVKVRKRRRGESLAASSTGAAFTADKLSALENLKAWRLRVAKELDQPAFVIFSDKALRDLVEKNPQTLEDLEHVYGFGPAKIERFGLEVLTELKLVSN